MILLPGGRWTCTGFLSCHHHSHWNSWRHHLPVSYHQRSSSVPLVILYLITAVVFYPKMQRHWSYWSSTATSWTCNISVTHLVLEWLIDSFWLWFYFMLSFWTCATKIYHLMLIIDNAKWRIRLTLALVLCYVELNSQIRLRFRLRPDLSSEIRPDPAPTGFGKVKSGTSILLTNFLSSSTSYYCQQRRRINLVFSNKYCDRFFSYNSTPTHYFRSPQ